MSLVIFFQSNDRMVAAQKCEQCSLMFVAQSCAIHAPQMLVSSRLKGGLECPTFIWVANRANFGVSESTLRRLAVKELFQKF